jgi:hypothetical protein
VLQQQFDQPPLPGPEVPVHTTACEAMEEFNRLLNQ